MEEIYFPKIGTKCKENLPLPFSSKRSLPNLFPIMIKLKDK